MDKKSELEMLEWVGGIVGIKEEGGDFFSLIEDGVVLCKLINKFIPGKCPYTESPVVFKKMENIESFLRAAKEIGVMDTETFQTCDLVFPEKRNGKQVAICIYSLSRNLKKKFPKMKHKVIGPSLATQNIRNFSEEKLREGEKVISLQMGSNKGATQSGLGAGKRQIVYK
jgi:transgelin